VSASARTTAERSAQMVMPNEPFSTLPPVTTSPDAVTSAAPTVNREYGA
jgi:hypothetical protein